MATTGPNRRIGVDTGGTFTDVVGPDAAVVKLASTPDDPGDAIRVGMGSLSGTAAGGVELAHGTTVATNAVLEGTLARVALLGTEGFGDLIEIGRQHRPSLADHWLDRPPPLVARSDRLDVAERLGPDGAAALAPHPSRLPTVPDGVEALAVCLLHADLNPAHEAMVAAAYRAQDWDVTASHEISPLFREYERCSTTVLNAALRPRLRGYLQGLEGVADSMLVMTSAGGLVPLDVAGDQPARLALSGPAGGVLAAADVAAACGVPDAISFDMGGTSTDVCLILGGQPAPAADRDLAGYALRLPSLDVHTVGAGGGSIASIDSGGALSVGPRSAGAVPGPAAYGRGGTRPTVTDANVALGRIPPESHGALGELDVAAAGAALAQAGVAAEGVLAVVAANMEGALRTVSVARGVDPAGLALVAFGGAGPLHACELAQSLGMATVIVPPLAGVLSAVGIVGAPERRDLTRSWPQPLSHDGVGEARLDLEAEAAALLGGHGGDVNTGSVLACRYAGQGHEIEVDDVALFGEVHRERNGYLLEDSPVEVIALRAFAERPAARSVLEVLAAAAPVCDGEVRGPASVPAADHTVWVPEGWVGRPGPLGAMILTPSEAGR
ncbi:MAG: hydantoinase/oxoprolinase family protein [Microthrixaceae bacterium]